MSSINHDLHHASSGGMIETSYDVSNGGATEVRKTSNNEVADSAPDFAKGVCNTMGLESAVSTQSGAELVQIPENHL